jgi:hypothetical protein
MVCELFASFWLIAGKFLKTLRDIFAIWSTPRHSGRQTGEAATAGRRLADGSALPSSATPAFNRRLTLLKYIANKGGEAWNDFGPPLPPRNERNVMKGTIAVVGIALATILNGCVSPPAAAVVSGPVGPNPSGLGSASPQGGLEVFSRLSAHSDDQNQASTNPVWYQHTDYYLCDAGGNELQRVYNAAGHYVSDPRTIHLPAGRYLVEAQSARRNWVRVPVIIKSGKVTRVHLDGTWTPPAYAAKSQVVTTPDGQPIGWRM